MKVKARGKPKAKATTNAYWWFQGASVRELYDRIGTANPDTARLEARPSGDKLTFRVVAESATAEASTADINESKVCPPICPH